MNAAAAAFTALVLVVLALRYASQTPPAMSETVFGIMGAMPQEIAKLKAHVAEQEEVKVNDFVTVTRGKIGTTQVVFTAANVGMVFASSIATVLVERFHITHLVFCGVAGGLEADVAIGDIVVAADVVNYDMNVKAFKLPWDPEYAHKRGELPFVNLHAFAGDETLIQLAMAAPTGDGVTRHRGRIATGSEFLTAERKVELKPLWDEIGAPLAVEMECAAVAQVAHIYKVPFVALRAISDTITGDATADFNAFCEQAADNLWPITEHIGLNFASQGAQ